MKNLSPIHPIVKLINTKYYSFWDILFEVNAFIIFYLGFMKLSNVTVIHLSEIWKDLHARWGCHLSQWFRFFKSRAAHHLLKLSFFYMKIFILIQFGYVVKLICIKYYFYNIFKCFKSYHSECGTFKWNLFRI